jgi:hypothetical protein
MCAVSCCCGTNEYTNITDNQFPTQQFIDRIAKWTDSVYVTSTYESFTIATNTKDTSYKGVASGGQYIETTGYKPMNGNIVVSCGLYSNEDEITSETTSETTSSLAIGLACSNNTIKLKDSEWMKTKITLDGVERFVRTMPSSWASSN